MSVSSSMRWAVFPPYTAPFLPWEAVLQYP